MKTYYEKDEFKLSVKNLQINEKNEKIYELEESILKKDVLYYENMFGAIIRFEDDCHTFTKEEAFDNMIRRISQTTDPEAIMKFEERYIDTSERFPLIIDKQTRKALKIKKKQLKKELRK